MFKRVGVSKDRFTVLLLNECFENECDLFILGHNFISFATQGGKKPSTFSNSRASFLQMRNLYFFFNYHLVIKVKAD